MARNISPEAQMRRAFRAPEFDVEVDFTIRGKFLSQRASRLHDALIAFGAVGMGTSVEIDIQTKTPSPSVLVEPVIAEYEYRGNIVRYAVTQRTVCDFMDAEFGVHEGPGNPNGVYAMLYQHYLTHHDWEIYHLRSADPLRIDGRLPKAQPPSCKCPLETIEGPSFYDRGPRRINVGLEPLSVVQCIDEGVRIEGAGPVRRKFLEAVSARLKSDVGISTD